jgi:nanoRNase/pAp phosphatase (c-di-AMP/oligoRNAs hydrolase)
VALVDTQPQFRNNSFPKRMKAAIVIDQHGSDQEPNADFSVVDPSCGATCVIIAQALLAVGKPIPKEVATALAYGIITDTQSFLRTSRRDVVQTYLDIIPSADMGMLAEIQNPKKPRRFFTTLMHGIGSAAKAGWLLFSHLGAVDYPDVVAEIADTLLSLRGIRWAMCTGRYKGRLRISLRSCVGRPAAADVLRDVVAHPSDAGGHDTIAGGYIKVGMRASEESWERAQQELSQKLIKRLRIPRAKTWRYPFRQGG